MDLRFSPEENKFREELRTFFREKVPAAIRNKVMESRHLDKEELVAAHKILHAKGLTVPHWPKEWGGADWTPVQHYIYTEELQFNGVPQPLPFNVSMCGPVVIAFGTEEQKKRFLPRMAALDDWWCQGFSEPGAGSDLASLKTTAVRQGDHYVVNGQKTWTTLAQYADWIFCLCRTDPGAKKQLGISFILIDMKTQGHHGAPDPDHGRRARGQRGVLRRRQGAGREPGRPGAPRLGLRQVPARQRAHRALPASATPSSACSASRSWPPRSRPATSR